MIDNFRIRSKEQSRVAQESPHGLKVPGSGSDRDIGRDFGTIGIIAKTVCFFPEYDQNQANFKH